MLLVKITAFVIAIYASATWCFNEIIAPYNLIAVAAVVSIAGKVVHYATTRKKSSDSSER